MESGKAVFVDVRPSHEYEQQHLPGDHATDNMSFWIILEADKLGLPSTAVGHRTSRCFVCAGAVNLPLYRAVETPGFYSNVKRFVMATAFAMTATGTVVVRVATGLSRSCLLRVPYLNLVPCREESGFCSRCTRGPVRF